jgi:rubrerythrin
MRNKHSCGKDSKKARRQTMAEENLIENLMSLAQVDRDATGVYDEALEHVQDEDLKRAFHGFRDEHERHVTVLAAAIKKRGGPTASEECFKKGASL